MSYKVYEAVNSNLLGLNKNERKSGDYQLHPLIRDDWRSVDKYRDLQGNVPALTTNANGDLIVDERVAISGETFFRPFKGPNSAYTQEDGPNNSDTITISLKAENYLSDWNEGNINEIEALNNLLEQNNPDNDFAGIPYFEKFFHVNNPPSEPYGLLTTDPRMQGATRNIKPIMQQDWSAGLTASNPIFNHKFNYRYYDRTMQDSTYNIEVESTYNLFLDTDPDYEAAIADVPEATIPNFYHVEMSIGIVQNAPNFLGLVPPAYKMFDNSVISNNDYRNLLEGSLSSSNITEDQTNSQGFLQFYANNVSNISSDYKTNFGNVAVLSYDVADGILSAINGTIRDNRGTVTEQDDFYAIETYPFYNKITIPYANQWAGNNIIETLIGAPGLDDDWVQNFITLLELLIIGEYKGSNTPSTSLPFTIYDTTDGGNKVVAQNLNVELAIRVEDVLTALIDQQGSLYERINNIFLIAGVDNYLRGSASISAGASFIQNYADEPALDGFFDQLNTWYASLNETDLQTALDTFGSFRNGPTGEFQRIYQSRGESNNESNHLDTPIMYMVEKRVIPVGQLTADPDSAPVQRLFFGRDITGGEKGVTYYDTQIKYGVRYQYDIKQIRLVVGERYYYDNYVSITNSGSVHQGRAIGNALGFYAEENIDITSTQTFQIANNLEGFSYLPEDEDTGFEDRTHFGYYVYKIPPDFGTFSTPDEAVNNIDDIFGVPGGVVSDGGFGPGRGQGPGTDLNLLLIRIRGGDGLDGNLDGGAIGVADVGEAPAEFAFDEDVFINVLAEEEEQEFNVDPDVIQGMTPQGAQTAEDMATSEFDAEIAAQAGSGQTQVGGISINVRTGQATIPGLANLTNNPLGPAASGGFGGNIPNIQNLIFLLRSNGFLGGE